MSKIQLALLVVLIPLAVYFSYQRGKRDADRWWQGREVHSMFPPTEDGQYSTAECSYRGRRWPARDGGCHVEDMPK